MSWAAERAQSEPKEGEVTEGNHGFPSVRLRAAAAGDLVACHAFSPRPSAQFALGFVVNKGRSAARGVGYATSQSRAERVAYPGGSTRAGDRWLHRRLPFGVRRVLAHGRSPRSAAPAGRAP